MKQATAFAALLLVAALALRAVTCGPGTEATGESPARLDRGPPDAGATGSRPGDEVLQGPPSAARERREPETGPPAAAPADRAIRAGEGAGVTPAPEPAVRDALHGRLVLAADGAPMDGAAVSAMLRPALGGDPGFARGTSDEGGHFELRLPLGGPAHVEVRLGGRFHEGLPLVSCDVAELPPDGDLGDVRVDSVRDVRFRLEDATGAPLEGGRGTAMGLTSHPTDAAGHGVLRWLPSSVDGVRFEAAGHVPRLVDVGPVPRDPVVVVLERATRLAVHLELPGWADTRQFKVVVRHPVRVTDAPVADRQDQRTLVGDAAFAPIDLAQAPERTFLAANLDPESGVATFHALRTGEELGLEVRGIGASREVYVARTVAPLAPGELRTVEVALPDDIVVFRGRVRAQSGEPLARASVQLGNKILGWTDQDGEFAAFLADPRPATLVVQHTAAATLFLHDFVVPHSGEPVEITLEPARRVTIEVVDEAGDPVPAAEVWIAQEGFTSNTHRLVANRHVASSLTSHPFEIVVRLAGLSYRFGHTSDRPEARVVVPRHGRVEASVARTATEHRGGEFSLVLVPLAGEAGGVVAGQRRSVPDLTFELPAVYPGRYEATLGYEPTEAERAAGEAALEASPVAIEVSAGLTSRLELDLPR